MRRPSAIVIAALMAVPATARAQQVVKLWPGVAPGSESWKQTETPV